MADIECRQIVPDTRHGDERSCGGQQQDGKPVSIAIERRQHRQPPDVEHRQLVVAAIQPAQGGARPQVERRKRIAAAIEPLQPGELLDPVQRSDPQPGAVHIENALRLVAGDTPVAVQIVVREAELSEPRVGKTVFYIYVFVLRVAFVVREPAGRQPQQRNQQKRTPRTGSAYGIRCRRRRRSPRFGPSRRRPESHRRP